MRDGCIRKLKQTTCSGNESAKVYDVVPFPLHDPNTISRGLSLGMRSPVVGGNTQAIHVYIIRYRLIKLLTRKSIFLSQLDSCTTEISFILRQNG